MTLVTMSVGPSTLPPKCIACFENLGSPKYAPVSLHFWTYKVAQKHEQFWLLFIQVQLWFDTIYIKSDIYTLRHDIFVLLDISRTTCPLINFTFYFVILSLSLSEHKNPKQLVMNQIFYLSMLILYARDTKWDSEGSIAIRCTHPNLFFPFLLEKLYILIQVHFFVETTTHLHIIIYNNFISLKLCSWQQWTQIQFSKKKRRVW